MQINPELLKNVVDTVLNFSEILPLPLFVFIGALLEDLISAIPSAVVYGLSGQIAYQRGHNYLYLILLIIIAALGKTIAAGFFYIVADKLEDHIPKKLRKFLKLDHEKIEEMGKKFSKGRKDDILIFAIRAIPSSPSMTVSFAAGFVKTKFSTFLIATFLGYLISTSLYFFAGYHGTEIFEELFKIIGSFVT